MYQMQMVGLMTMLFSIGVSDIGLMTVLFSIGYLVPGNPSTGNLLVV